MLLRREMESALGEGGTWDGGGETGMERPTTDEGGSKEWEAEAKPSSRDSNELFRTGDGSGAGASVGLGAGVDAVDKNSLTAHNGTIFRCVTPSRG